MVIVLAHDKGGTGKTTTATNLAVELLKESKPLKILDIDPKQMTRLFFEIRFEKMSKKARPEILSLSQGKEEKELIDLINNLDDNENLLIDTGGFDKDLNRIAMTGADFLIVPLKDNEIEIHGFSSFLPVLERIQKEYQESFKVHILLNRIHESRKNDIGKPILDYIQESGQGFLHVMQTVLRSRSAYEVAYGQGMSVVEFEAQINKNRKKKDKSALNAAKEIKQLVKEIHGKN
ncbi:AAA family ATPase [Sulfurospirillum sp. T05]|uniref:AAA family ATPase n=1 Tax=Sulfurospirillum tamanense TaxID=2813362 RepID=A0ABS2WV70_9BACT|nr:division plane positioning ATPase MipZ [Sulfurospirillum tamanensis]MBN2965273.1 AAA family ATPase [Sulfurospirillum tamanensis]